MKKNNINDEISLLQIKYDGETVYRLIEKLPQDNSGVTIIGMIPYLSLTVASVLEIMNINSSESNYKKLSDVRMKLKLFENSYGKAKKMILNIDYLQDQIFKKRSTVAVFQNSEKYYNLGLYTDNKKNIIGNTHLAYYMFKDSRTLKKNLEFVSEMYVQKSENFDLDKKLKQELYEYGYYCGEIIGLFHGIIVNSNPNISIIVKKQSINYYYADFNTHKYSEAFPTTEDGKGVSLYILHIISTINFLLYVLNPFELDDYGWWGKVNYITYYYSIHKLRSLHRHLEQNKLLTPKISEYFQNMQVNNAKYFNTSFRNYVMHSKFIDKNGNFLIEDKYFAKEKILFGLVETCFNGISYFELKKELVKELRNISEILSDWIGIKDISTKILD